MSDWELVSDPSYIPSAGKSEWEVVHDPISSQENSGESLGQAALRAIPRIGEDLYRGGMGFIKDIPGYYKQAQTEVPGAFNTISQHPLHALGQFGAGITELGHNAVNFPRGVADYASNRLNLLPREFASMVPYQEDISEDINKTFGEPQYEGENLIRGIGRNASSLLGAGKVSNVLNPMNLTAKSIAKDVLNEEGRQVKSHSRRYNKIWDEADRSGFNEVPYSFSLRTHHFPFIKKYYPDKSTRVFRDFLKDPTLQNAQKAQSDLGNLRRQLEEKSRKTPLLETEKYLHEALFDAEKNIENNMFKDAHGNVNNALQDKYKKLTNSYRENVVPYKYNKDIQKYKAKESLPKELVNSLSKGEFAAKKGDKHPAIKIRNNLGPLGVGTTAIAAMPWLYKQMFGNETIEQ